MSYFYINIYAVDQTICKNKKRKCFISLKKTKSKFYRSDTDSSTATKTTFTKVPLQSALNKNGKIGCANTKY